MLPVAWQIVILPSLIPSMPCRVVNTSTMSAACLPSGAALLHRIIAIEQDAAAVRITILPTAGEPVTAEQAAASGAPATEGAVVAGRPADACYHQSCDDLANADLHLARTLTAGLADFTVRVANNPELLRH